MIHRRKFIKYLEKNGVTFLRANGKHHIYQNAEGVRHSISLHTKTVSPGVARQIAKHFNIPSCKEGV